MKYVWLVSEYRHEVVAVCSSKKAAYAYTHRHAKSSGTSLLAYKISKIKVHEITPTRTKIDR